MSRTLTAPALRPLSPADRRRIEEITRAVSVFRDDEVPVALEVFDGAVAGSPDYIALGATVDERLVGWICWGPTPCTLGTYDLYWMAVDPAAQAAGIGTALLREMEGRLAGSARRRHPGFLRPRRRSGRLRESAGLGPPMGPAASRRLPPPYPALPSLRVPYQTSIPRDRAA